MCRTTRNASRFCGVPASLLSPSQVAITSAFHDQAWAMPRLGPNAPESVSVCLVAKSCNACYVAMSTVVRVRLPPVKLRARCRGLQLLVRRPRELVGAKGLRLDAHARVHTGWAHVRGGFELRRATCFPTPPTCRSHALECRARTRVLLGSRSGAAHNKQMIEPDRKDHEVEIHTTMYCAQHLRTSTLS